MCVGIINALEVGLISTRLGAGREKVEDTVDYCAGIMFRRKVGEAVEKGGAAQGKKVMLSGGKKVKRGGGGFGG